MGDSWVVPPNTRRLPLSDDQWIVVKERLNTGEYRAYLRGSSTVDEDGRRRIDFMEHTLSRLVAYLVDWSADPPIRGASEADRRAALDLIDPDRFTELDEAVQAHIAARDAERAAAKKKTTTGAAVISPLPSDVVGASSGSVN